MLEKLVTELDVDHRAVYRLPGPLDLSGLSAIADLDLRQLKYPAFVPAEGALPQDRSVFRTLSERDVLVHLPYDSFTASVQRLVVSAAADPRVLAIKHTLYRTSGDSEIVDALIDAAEAGKQVVVVVEIKARGDEEANIAWARKLEEAGCHVVYGFVGLKTHCKMVLVVREEADGSLRRFCHIGTGNYHPKTARLYEDYGLLTADPQVGEDVTDLFNHLTGYSRRADYHRLLVAPAGLRSGLIEQIDEQVRLLREGRPARIQMKCNAIIDEAIIDALYQASIAGVPIDLWVRGICSLRPGVPGLSETIRVRSIVGRFLEHSRIYAFGAGGPDSSDDVWMGSADLMHRNLDRRVELLIRVTDPAHKAELRSLIDLAMDPSISSWWLGADGSWTRHHLDETGAPLIDLQEHLIRFRQNRPADADVKAQQEAAAREPSGPAWLTPGIPISSGPREPWSGVPARRARTSCSCTGRGMTTGPFPRASASATSMCWRRQSARSARRPGCASCSDGGSRHRSTESGGSVKRVSYWAARCVGSDGFVPSHEVDEVQWLPAERARDRLSYERDVAVLDEFSSGPVMTVPLVLLRHAAAGRKSDWARDSAAAGSGRQWRTWPGRSTLADWPRRTSSPTCWPATGDAR